MNKRVEIFQEIHEERKYQDGKWGGHKNDSKNELTDWVCYIVQYATKWLPGNRPPYNLHTISNFREHMVKVAALAVAAIEQIDKKHDLRKL